MIVTKMRILFLFQDLDDIGNHLRKLKVLHIKVEKDGHQMVTFFERLSKLRHLKMESDGESGFYGGYNWLNFSSQFHPLEVLELDNMAQSNPGLSWYNWFKHFPYLKTIKLKNCVLNHWFDFIAQISWLEKLDCLVLDGVSDRNGTFDNYPKNPNPNNIKVLKVRGDTMSAKELAALLEGCPNLEKVYLLNMDVTQRDVLEVLQRKGENFDGFLLNDNDVWSVATLEDVKCIIDRCKDLAKSYQL